MNLLPLPNEIQRLAQLGAADIDEGNWRDYSSLEIRAEHIPALISILENIDDFTTEDEDDPAYYFCMHVWRALASLQAETAIPTMVRLLDRVDIDDDILIDEDLPRALSKMGPAVYPFISNALADNNKGGWARIGAAEALALFAHQNPEYRIRVINDLSAALSDYQTADITENTILVELLMKLKAVEAAPLVEQVYHANRVEGLFLGDWEDFQVGVGLLKERQTPPTYSQAAPSAFMDGDTYPPSRSKEDSKTKKENKQARQSRKANRRKKKK